MSFADQYLARQSVSGKIESQPSPDLRFIVVIPCFNEPDLTVTLNSLWDCDRPEGPLEIIVVVNSPSISSEGTPEENQKSKKLKSHPEARDRNLQTISETGQGNKHNSLPEARDRNLQTISDTHDWISEHNDPSFRTYIIHEPDLPPKYAGPGLARKIGMDEAAVRFNGLERPDGVILSMDADCTVDRNYFVEIERQFTREPKTRACSIYFEHPVSGDEFPPETYEAIAAYELHLRYYIQAIRNTGFPYAYHTVGSCFGVTAQTYVKQGGMNKRKGGEDFYFLQKTIPLGDFFDINSTCVYPSPRPSDRVPFGTGPVVRKYMDSGEEFMTYDPLSFYALLLLFDMPEQLFNADSQSVRRYLNALPIHLSSFLEKDFEDKISEINSNSASKPAFLKHFYRWFNMFKILKYLNFVHEEHFTKLPVNQAATTLLNSMGIQVEKDKLELVKSYREIQREKK